MSEIQSQSLRTPRACDECRTRKTRCEGVPCQRCKAAGLDCHVTTQKASRVKDGTQNAQRHETRMDRMERRLARIEGLLERLCEVPSAATAKGTEMYNTPASRSDPDERSGTYAGTGVVAESVAAKDAATHKISQDQGVQSDVQLTAALASLRDIVARIQRDPVDYAKDLVVPAKDCNHPTRAQVMALLDRVSIRTSDRFDWLSRGLLEDFIRKCRAMYDHGSKDCPTEILVYSLLSNLSLEFSQGPDADYYFMLSKNFAHLLLKALQSFPLLTTPSMDTAEALMNAATTTISLCKPSLTWILLNTACRMVLNLRYHQLSPSDAKSDPLWNRKVILFWSCYVLERSSCLRLGRQPSIDDADIQTPMLADNENNPVLVSLLEFWVRCARVQGRISSEIKRSGAERSSENERLRIAEALAEELERIHQAKLKANADILPFFEGVNPAADMMVSGETVLHCSTMTMALATIPATQGRAINFARTYLRTNIAIRQKHFDVSIYDWIIYCNWHILNGPLAPFTGVFSSVIANPLTSQNDLSLLQDFIAILKPAITLSEGIDKFYQLCAVFVQVAQGYVRAKIEEHSREAAKGKERKRKRAPSMSLQDVQPAIGEFDEQLAALGLDLFAPGEWDWCSGSTALYGFLDQGFHD